MRGIKAIRLKDYDYRSDGYYFVTVVSRLRQNLFANQKSLVESQLKDLVEKTKGLSMDYFVVMPNHVHVIFILENAQIALGEIIRRFKAKVSRAIGQNVWQPNYYEHVIRNETALNKIREYIINNPQAELLDFEEFYKVADKSAGYINSLMLK